MFNLSGRILDWVDEEGPGTEKIAEFGFLSHALILEDCNGSVGRKYPIPDLPCLRKSMDSFEKFAERLMPLHRRVAATFMNRECFKYDVPPTDKVAMYADNSIESNMVSFRSALADYEPSMIQKRASSLIRELLKDDEAVKEDFVLDSEFVKSASCELSMMLKDSGSCEYNDPLIKSIKKLASDGIPVKSTDMESVVDSVCDISNVEKHKTMFRHGSASWPRATIEKNASVEEIGNLIVSKIGILSKSLDRGFVTKLAQDPMGVLSKAPVEICKIVADIIYSEDI